MVSIIHSAQDRHKKVTGRMDIHRRNRFVPDPEEGITMKRPVSLRAPAGLRLRPAAVIFLCIVSLLTLTACASVGTHEITGTEHLPCAPEVHFIEHQMVCTKGTPGGWEYSCEVTGVVENSGQGDAIDVMVQVDFGREFAGMRSGMFNSMPGYRSRYVSRP